MIRRVTGGRLACVLALLVLAGTAAFVPFAAAPRAAPPSPGPAPLGPAPLGPAPLGPATLGPAPPGPAPLGPAPLGPAPPGPALPSPRPAGVDIAVAPKDGLLTAIFSDQTDDAALNAALPALLANNVQSIVLHGAAVRDLHPLARMTALQALDIGGTQVRDLTPLRGLTGLRSLNLQFVPVSDLRPLAGLVEMRFLHLGGTDVRDLAPLAGMTNLRELVVAVTQVTDLTPLAPLRRLTSLDLGSTWVSSVAPLAGMTSLRALSLNGTPVSDVQALGGMTALERLDLGGTQVSDISPLAGLRKLQTLDIEGTRVADVRPLAGLTALREVSVGGSRVKDMTPLARLAAAPAATATDPKTTDPVLFWNDQTNRAIQATATDAFAASRALALESIAVLDTANSIDGAPAFLVRLPAPRDVVVAQALAAAAHEMLLHLFPTQQAALDDAYAVSLAGAPAGSDRSRSSAFGQAMADAVISIRDDDGWSATATTRAGDAPGQWRPTPPDYLPPLHPEWASLTPFAMTAPDQFRPAPPPGPGSAVLRAATDEVAALGGARSTQRTAEQTEIARYWSDAIGTYAPAGHWNAITANLIAPLRLGVAAEAEMFAELNVALADAGIAMADAKYTYWSWRPITVIRGGGGGAAPIPDWTPLLETPNHPGYISGHSAFSGAAATVLTARFGGGPFTFTSASLPGVKRRFASFQQAAEEAAASRVYGGIHFSFDNAAGLATGRAVGAWTLAVFQRLADDRGPIIMVDAAGGMGVGMGMGPGGVGGMGMGSGMGVGDTVSARGGRAITGCALDNLSPVSTVTARLDGGEPFSLPVDDKGWWTLPPERLAQAGRHEVVLTATSVTGRSSSVRVDVGS